MKIDHENLVQKTSLIFFRKISKFGRYESEILPYTQGHTIRPDTFRKMTVTPSVGSYLMAIYCRNKDQVNL